MLKKFLEFGAGIVFGTLLAKSSIIFGMAVEDVKTKRKAKESEESKTTEQES